MYLVEMGSGCITVCRDTLFSLLRLSATERKIILMLPPNGVYQNQYWKITRHA